MDNEKTKLIKFVITFQNDDKSTTKYLVSCPSFYEAKQEAITMQEDINTDKDISYRIDSYDVKESKVQ